MKTTLRIILIVLALSLPATTQVADGKKVDHSQQDGGSTQTSSVPEPGVLVVVGSGILALALFNRKKK